jgi:hypothetical protein
VLFSSIFELDLFARREILIAKQMAELERPGTAAHLLRVLFVVGPMICAEKACLFFLLEALCNISHRLVGITPFGVFSDAFPGLKMWVTFACATVIFLTHFIISLAVLESVQQSWRTCPLMQGYRKETLFHFHTKRRSGRDRESSPGHLVGRQRLDA